MKSVDKNDKVLHLASPRDGCLGWHSPYRTQMTAGSSATQAATSCALGTADTGRAVHYGKVPARACGSQLLTPSSISMR